MLYRKRKGDFPLDVKALEPIRWEEEGRYFWENVSSSSNSLPWGLDDQNIKKVDVQLCKPYVSKLDLFLFKGLLRCSSLYTPVKQLARFCFTYLSIYRDIVAVSHLQIWKKLHTLDREPSWWWGRHWAWSLNQGCQIFNFLILNKIVSHPEIAC